MIINFVLLKYNQTETALKLQPTSQRLLERRAALIELILLDMRKNRKRGKLNV